MTQVRFSAESSIEIIVKLSGQLLGLKLGDEDRLVPTLGDTQGESWEAVAMAFVLEVIGLC